MKNNTLPQMTDAQCKFVVNNYNLIYRVLNQIPHPRDMDSDLEQVAAEALCISVIRFDESLGTEFSTYAVPCIRGQVLTYLNRCTHMIRPSFDVLSKKEDYKYSVLSTEDIVAENDGDTLTLGETLVDPDNPYDEIESNTLELIMNYVNKSRLSDQSKEILKIYYTSKYNGDDLSLADIARNFSVTRSRVYEVVSSMNRRLRKYMENF